MVMDKIALMMIQVVPSSTVQAMVVVGINIILINVLLAHMMSQEPLLSLLQICAVHAEVELQPMLIIRQVIHGSLVLLGHQTQPDPVLAKS